MGDIEEVWRGHVKLIRKMRESKTAPVDTMGCHMLADKNATPETHRFQVLVSLMLSSQTKDEVTAKAMERLKSHGCSIEKILTTPKDTLEKLIYPVGFYRRKAEYIQKTAAILRDMYGGDIPKTETELSSLPGVGPKMAILTIQTAWGRTDGIAVDTHVHRIANRLKWTKTTQPEKTRIALENLIPPSEWRELNKLLVGFGQETCLPVNPRCSSCLLAGICPSSTKDKKRMKRREVDNDSEGK